MPGTMTVNGIEYTILKLLGHGKGGYSYLSVHDGQYAVLKQIHHEPCAYYSFGNKIEAERNDYERLKNAGIRIPKMLDIDMETERIVKEYIEGQTVFEMVRDGASAAPFMEQVREMAGQAKEAGLNIDFFPTNFVVRDGLLFYVDYECNPYMDEWNFENWGIKYWSRTQEFEAHLKELGGKEHVSSDAKKLAFFDNARLLADKMGIIPLMYGSLGLEYLTGENLNADDIDILIPKAFIEERWPAFKTALAESGYTLVDEHEHAFEKNGICYAYAQIEELNSFAGIRISEIETITDGDVRFMLLSLRQYLSVYAASIKDGYRINVREKKDAEKIAFIKSRLGNREEN